MSPCQFLKHTRVYPPTGYVVSFRFVSFRLPPAHFSRTLSDLSVGALGISTYLLSPFTSPVGFSSMSVCLHNRVCPPVISSSISVCILHSAMSPCQFLKHIPGHYSACVSDSSGSSDSSATTDSTELVCTLRGGPRVLFRLLLVPLADLTCPFPRSSPYMRTSMLSYASDLFLRPGRTKCQTLHVVLL